MYQKVRGSRNRSICRMTARRTHMWHHQKYAVCIHIWHTNLINVNFFISNTLVGVGWNLMYIGGSSLLTETYEQSERAKVQASHDFMVFAITVIAAGLSGLLQAHIGWVVLNLIILIVTIMFVLFLLSTKFSR